MLGIKRARGVRLRNTDRFILRKPGGEHLADPRLVAGSFWAMLLSTPVGIMLIGIKYIAYWTISPIPVLAKGD